MEMIIAGLLDSITPISLMFVFLGVAIGVLIGAIPGINGPMAIALFIPATLLFLQVLFNDSDAYRDLVGNSKSAIGLVVILIYKFACFGTWAYFRRRSALLKMPPADTGANPDG